jgi:hypothetical protein
MPQDDLRTPYFFPFSMNDRHLSQADIIDIAVFSDLRESLTGI